MSFSRQKENNNKMASTIRHALGYLPATLLKSIIEEKIYLGKNEKLPITLSFQTCCIYLDTSHFFENGTGMPNIINKNKKLSNKTFKSSVNIPEFYYFFFNRFHEKVISTITNHGGDIIFEGLGAYAIWPPERSDVDNYKYNKVEEITNICLKCIQCAIDLQKKTIKNDLPNTPSFAPKIGICVGNCKFIILKGVDGKYEYTAFGDALLDSFNCAEQSTKRGEIITNEKMKDILEKFCDFSFVNNDNKYMIIHGIKNTDPLVQNIKSTVNIIRNNFTLEQILKKREVLSKFNSFILSDIFQRPILSEKWNKEIIYLTLLYLRFKTNQKDFDDPNKLQEIYQIIQKIVFKYGGNVHKILTDGGGFIFQIAFGTLKSKTSQHEVMGVLASFEICFKLKKINVFPFIGISTGLTFYGLIGTIGGRRELTIISSLTFFGMLCMQKAESMYGDKRYGNDDNILMDESTMLMIDSKIPCKFWQKAKCNLGVDINLFVPLKIETLIHKHTEPNLFPLIGTHLHSKDETEYQLDDEIVKEDDIIYFEEQTLKDMVKLFNYYALNKTKVKLINVTSLTGCGKTLLLRRCLDNFFQENLKLKEILCNLNFGYNYPFIFNANLLFVINSNILLQSDNLDYRGIQFILKDIFEILYSEDNGKERILKIISRNGCDEYINYIKKLFEFQKKNKENEEIEDENENNEEDNESNKKEINKSRENSKKKESNKELDISFVLTDKVKEKLNLFFLDLIKEYKTFINDIYKETLSLYDLTIPIILIIEDFNTCDNVTKEFIRFYLKQDSNDFLVLTANSIPLYPPYVYLDPYEKDPFYDFQGNLHVKKYDLSLYDTTENISRFIQSVIGELKGKVITSVSPNILKFLLNKTFCGNPQFIMKLILNIYDQNLVTIVDKELVETKNFAQMIKYNDFTELNIPKVIEKKISEIINNQLDVEEICLLKIASLLGDIFELTRLKQVIIIDSSSTFVNSIKNGEELCLYKKLRNLESKYIIEILEDLDIKHKFVVCKFSIPFLREILYKRIPSEQRNQLHYIIGKMIKINFASKGHKKNKYMSDEMELEMLKKHLKYSEVAIHENFLKGNFTSNEPTNDNLNINNLKTLIIQQICAKISSIKINDDKNNMIKAGYIYKKSDGKLTWENRYFVLTTNRVVYFYNKEDYKKDDRAPLGIFYLQNLFSVKLLTDGSVGGRKNIFSLSVNEWIKKGNFMTQRIYYLSIEDREELYKWMITFNILKIKAFYDNYCISFGYVNFPLYDTSKNEIIIKPNNIKFDFEDYKQKEQDQFDFIDEFFEKKRKKTAKRMSIFNPYFIIGDKETKMEDIEHENSSINILLLYLKFVIKYILMIFFANIQMAFKKTRAQFDNKIKFTFSNKVPQPYIDFCTPTYIQFFYPKDPVLGNEINKLKNNVEYRKRLENEKKINSIYANSVKNEFTSQEQKYFSTYYEDFFHPKINKIDFHVVSLKRILKAKNLVKGNYKLFTREDNKLSMKKEKVEWDNSILNDKESFKYCDDEKIDNNDFLRYTDYIEKYDNSGSNRDNHRPSYFRNSISSKPNDFNNNNFEGYPILDGLRNNRVKNLEKNLSQSHISGIGDFNNVINEIDEKLVESIRNSDNEDNRSKKKSKSKDKKNKKSKKKGKKKSKKKSKNKNKNNDNSNEKQDKDKSKDKSSEITNEMSKDTNKEKNKNISCQNLKIISLLNGGNGGGSNLYSIISEETSEERDRKLYASSILKKSSNKLVNWNDLTSERSRENSSNHYDLANEVRKSKPNGLRLTYKNSYNSYSKKQNTPDKIEDNSIYSSIDEKDEEESLTINDGVVNDNFSFSGNVRKSMKTKKTKSKHSNKDTEEKKEIDNDNEKKEEKEKDKEKEKEKEKEKNKSLTSKNKLKSQVNENNETNSLVNNVDSSLANSSKSGENNNIIENNINNSKNNLLENSKSSLYSNKNGEITDIEKNENIEANENNENNENTEVLSFKDKSNELLEGNENSISHTSSNFIKKNSNNIISNKSTLRTSANVFNITNNLNANSNNNNKAKPKEYAYLKEISLSQKFIISMKSSSHNQEKVKNEIRKQDTHFFFDMKDKLNKLSKKSRELSSDNNNSEMNTLDSDMFSKLREINVSLDNEKTYTSFFKTINKDIASNNTYKEISNNQLMNNKSNSRSKKSTIYSQEATNGSSHSNLDNIGYPDVYYINEDNNLHSKTHISLLFSKLKNKNNNSNSNY